MIRYIFLISLYIISFCSSAQDYYVKNYRVKDGLPSDIIKGSIQDSLGYFWVATDEGLAKYDGIRFTNFARVTHSNYVKGIFKTTSNRLLAYGDLDLLEIKNLGDTVIFDSLCPVTRIASDSSLSYPKLIYEDVQNNLWISESQSVVQLQNNQLKRYEFDLANRSPQFLRSFSFFEDLNSDLYVCSFQGNIFKYNQGSDRFELFDKKFPYGVEFVGVFQNHIMVGTQNGIWKADLQQLGDFHQPALVKNIPDVSFISPLPDNKYFIATRGTQHYIADFDENHFEKLTTSINNVNHIYVSNENDIWISGNEGLIMMKENTFFGINEEVADFIESISEDPDLNTIYYAINSTLYSYHREKMENTVLQKLPSGYYQSLINTDDGLWVANAFQVFLFDEGKIKKQFDFSRYRLFVTGLSKDSRGNIWLSIPGLSNAYMIDKKHELHSFKIPLGEKGVINSIKGGSDGIYVCSAGASSYLFFKPNGENNFQNVSTPLDIEVGEDFNVTDIAFTSNGTWLASTNGLLKYELTSASKIKLDDRFNDLPVKAVSSFINNKLLLSNAFGLIIFDVDTNMFDLYNESTGLPSNTITPRGFFIGHDSTIWVGTAKGLCYSYRSLLENNKTPQPQFIHFQANGNLVNINEPIHVDHASFLNIEASPITFPENEVLYKYRFLPDSAWNISTFAELDYAANEAGEHVVEIIAKKNGPYDWSDPVRLNFSVLKPFWQKWWFYMVVIVFVIILVSATSLGVNSLNKSRNRKLESLIDMRTNELKESNEQLVNLNIEKNNLISIVAHDLKSPLHQMKGIISIIKMTDKEDNELAKSLDMINDITQRMNELIVKILDVDAIESNQLNINIETLNLSELLNEVANRFENVASKKHIAINRNIKNKICVNADRGYLEQVIDNLLSNAIKFSPFDRRVFVNLDVNNTDIVIEIKDEGPGISEADQQKMFIKYQKLSAKPTDNENSTGLGLLVAKKFVTMMNGNIWCESELGKGTSFFVSFESMQT